MALPAAVPIAMAGASVLGGLMGEIGGASRRKAAERALREYLALAKNQLGMDPQKALQFLGLSDRSAYDNLPGDMRDMSVEATRRMLERGSGTGLDTQSRVALSEANRAAGGQARAARQAVLAEYQNRGTAGAPAELAAQMMGAQQAYEGSAASGGTAAAAAEQRRLEANLLGSRSAQSQQGIDQAKAAALDALYRFNTQAKQGTIQNQISAMGNIGNAYGAYVSGLQANANAGPRTGANIGGAAGVLGGLGYQYGQGEGWWGGDAPAAGAAAGASSWGGSPYSNGVWDTNPNQRTSGYGNDDTYGGVWSR